MNDNLKLSLSLEVKDGQFKAKIKDAAGNIVELGQVGDKAGKAVEGGFSKARRGIESISQTLQHTRNELIGFFGLSQGLQLAKSLLQTNVEMDRLRGQLIALTGSAEKARTSFNFIQKFAVDTPFQIQGLTEAFITLGNFGITPTAEVMSAITNQAAKLGASQETLSGITLALGQAWAKSKFQGEEILQLIDRGVPAWKILEEVTGQNAAALQELASKGELGRDVIAKFIDKMGELSTGGNAAAMDTLGGKISNLSDAWERFQDTLLQDKSEGILKSIINGLSETLSLFTREMSTTLEDEIASLEQRLKFRDFGFIGKAVYSIANIGSTVDQAGKDDGERRLAELKKLKVENDARAAAEAKATEETKKATLAMADEARQAAELAKTYKALTQSVDESTKQRLLAVDTTQTQRIRTIETTVTDTGGVDRGRERERQITQVLIEANRERSRINQASADERLRLIDQAHAKEVESAKKANQSTKDIDKSWLDSKYKVLQDWQASSRKTIDELIALEKKHRDAAIQADTDIANHKRATADLVKQLQGRTDVNTAQDLSRLRGDAFLQKREITDAGKKGDIEGELQAAKRVEQAYIDVAQKAKQAFDQGLIDESTLNSTIYDLQAAAKQVDQITAKQGEQQKQAAAQVAGEIAKQQATLATVNGQMDALFEKAKAALVINVDAKQVDAVKAAIDAIPSEKTVTIKTVNEGGAPVTPADPAVPGYADGTRLAGFGGGDRHPALLESGEGVVNKFGMRALDQAFGPGFFDGVNAGANPIELLRRDMHTLKLSDGGRINVSLPSVDFAGAGGQSGTPVNIHLPSGQTFGPFNGSADSAAALANALEMEVLRRGARR